MKLRLVAIGNSRGLRLPKAILEQCRLENEVELEIEAGRLIIKPARRSTRKGWDEAFKKMGVGGGRPAADRRPPGPRFLRLGMVAVK